MPRNSLTNGDERLWQELTPMQLATAQILRAHTVTPKHAMPGIYQCLQCHESIIAPDANAVNVERFHQSQVIIRALAGDS